MSEQHQPEDVRINNERSLQQLTWAIEASVGQFKLILARCNYASWRIRLIERSREISKVEIRVLVLKESAKTLYTAIREELGEEVPASLMVLGLESVGDLAQMLASANQVREEFRQNFHFPLVLWIDDEIHKQMMQFAPDLESWATTKSFALSPNELIDFLQQTAEQFFTISSTLSLEDCRQIKSAWQDLQNSGQVLKPEVKADCDFLLGLVEYIDNHVDIAIEYYLLSLAFWQQRNDLQRQGKLLENLTFCYYEKARKCSTERPQAGSLGLHEQSLPSQAQDNSNSDWEATINYLGQCLEVFEAAQRPDLVANSIDKFGIILRYLEDWEQLQKLAKRALQLHENEGNAIKIAQDYGFLAEVALAKKKWNEAKELAQKALEILSTISSESIPTQVNRPQTNVETRNFASLGLPAQADNSANSHRQRFFADNIISYITSSYLFILARSQQKLDQNQTAISNLETARKIGVTDNDPQLYIDILRNLQKLYFQQKQYLEAFKAKLERRSIQQQFGLRAFIGAGRLEATRQVKLPQIVETRNFASPQENVAPEITASGRQLDVERLLERIGRPDYKLIVIYGQSGVGKSSLVNAGLVPALKNKAIGTQDNLPVAIRVYTNWLEDLGRLLVEALAEKGIQPATDVVTDIADNLSVTSVTTSAAAILEQLQQTESHNQHWAQIFDQTDDVTDIADNLSVTSVTTSAAAILEQLQQTESHNLRPVLIFDQPDIANNLSVTSVTTSAAAILKQLRQTEQHNLRPVLIFDQFEEFFFVETEPAQRRQFFEFLGQCLNILPVKVILSLREDYLHYLLKCNRLPGISIIDIDILSKRVLYELGNFSPDDAKSIIQQLTERSHFHLEPALIDELVKDLAGNLEEVRPIELQVVGAQLQTDDITTLAEYEQRGPKEELVKRYLAEVVEDCGPENQQIAEFLLYLLTDEKGTRPLKTRAELEQDLQALGLTVETRLIASLQELDLVLLIFVKSGLVVLLPENPADRYQLVHDYIAAFIRQQRAELETERKQRLLTEQQLKQSEQAQQILAEANQKAKQRIRIGSGVLVISVVVGGIAALFANQTYNLSKEAQTGTRLERQGVTAWQQFQFQETESLLSAMHAGQELQAIVKDGRPLEEYPAASPQFALQTILENIHEKNQLKGHTSGVYRVSFSPDGKRIVTASDDNTARVWDLSGQQIAELKGHTGYVYSASFSPDGKRIVTASDDNTARVWDLSGQQIAELKGHTGYVYSASFSPDGKRIVTASDDNTARVWDLSGQQIAELKGHTGYVYSASFSPDGKRIVTASDDNTARVWDLSGQQIAELKGHTSPVNSASFSPDGKRIVTASDDNTARVWDLSGQQIAELKGHTGYVYSASFSPDGKRIVTASWDNTARVWHVESLDELLSHGCAWLSDYLVIHPKDLETLELCQNKSNLKAAAPFLVKEGEAEARTGKIDEAVATFRTAFKWNPNLKLDPTAKAQEFANKGQAKRLVAEGVSLVKNGKVKEAVADYTKAQELDPKVEINADSWRSLCWYGSLRKQAADVMFACNKAVALSPKNSDSRGLARALTGNTQGAIEDFEAYIASTENKKGKSKVQQWVNSLRAGKNPFTDEELKSLLKQ